MKSKGLIVFSVFFIAIVVAAFYFLNTKSSSDPIVNLDTTTVETPSRYLPYSSENLAKAFEVENGKAVIFFHAPWCPYCRAAEADFLKNWDKVPSNVTILKTDYDTSTQLKKKYAITTQDTFVLVDKNGKEVKKWISGGYGVKALLENL